MNRRSSQVEAGFPRWISRGCVGGMALFCGWVHSVQAATNAVPVPPALRDIKGPILIGSRWAWLGSVAAILGVGALIALAWWWWQRGRPKEVLPGMSAAERARRRLQDALQWIEDPDRFVTQVSEIARTYLEERFGLHAPDRTTEEFLAELAGDASLESRHKQLLAEFLTGCDLVKFARAETNRSELQALHQSAERLVSETAVPSPPVLNP